MPRLPRRPLTGLLVATACALLASCEPSTGPVLPILPPLTISTPDADGLVSINGDAEPDALVFGYNEVRRDGAITTADAVGRYLLTLGADPGDEISVWQRVGTQDGAPRVVTVPAP